ncbi:MULTISPECIES: hypothetical protein [Leuconostoc]|jgi:prefoldin subunit 5|uniref:Uncharacterized protein n=3 Tax=root TaxID=1 RepID=B1MZF1_LEUCK|nr:MULTISPECIES: hypothetical protein [Leuconostoc]ACA82903.1 Protein of unknown function [Leuconostoc citreum KM20]KAF0261129.1 hypothetical protein CRI81_02815 [Leuconostoc citreum]MBA5939016.1 hypothetical protein [Leuconostoc citreum]MBU7450050.1 hypothetical protein [Leuconostoc citreum]MCJ2166782.1 hypothetical protein [Leuconostoc citreum]
MKLIDDIKQLIKQIQLMMQLLQQLTKQQQVLSQQLDHLTKVRDDIQVDVEKMNFKNKPHLDRIQKASDHLNAELSKYQA